MKESVKKILEEIPQEIKDISSRLAYDLIFNQTNRLLREEFDSYNQFLDDEGISLLPNGDIFKSGHGEITKEEFENLKDKYFEKFN